MVRTIIGTAAAMCLSILLMLMAVLIVLRHTDFGLVASGRYQGPGDQWQLLMSGVWVMFIGVMLPVAITTSALLGLWARKHVAIAAAIANAPLAIIAAGYQIRYAWMSVILVCVAGASATLTAMMLERYRHRKGQVV